MARPRKVTKDRVQNEARQLMLSLLQTTRREIDQGLANAVPPSAAMVSAATSLLKLAAVEFERDEKSLAVMRQELFASGPESRAARPAPTAETLEGLYGQA